MPLNATDGNERNMTGASNKAFEYLAQGVPLLVSDLQDWKDMFVAPGLASVCRPDDPRSLAEAIAWHLEHRRESQLMGERGRQTVLRDWNYERQFKPVYDLLTVHA